MKLTKEYTLKLIKDLWIALRPLSLTLAIASTTLGIVIAYKEGSVLPENLYMNLFKIFLVTLGGVLVQGGANLVNDFFEGSFKYKRPETKTYKFLKYQRTKFDLLVFAFSMACFGGTALIGLYLLYVTDIKLIYVGIAGIIGSYAYTGEPIVYKKRGLGTPLSFLLMGPLMVLGAYFVFTGKYAWNPVIISTPAALMIPLMMLSNELRDFERDKKLGLKTLVVKIGSKPGRILYFTMLVTAYGLTTALVLLDRMPFAALLVYATLPIAVKAYKKVSAAKGSGIPITNKLHIAFNAVTILALLLG
jgi:1,4-dihydroxy-2-naphthoate octaprenyltransferase